VHVGLLHAGRTLDVEAADTTLRVYDGDQLITETPRTTTKPIVRYRGPQTGTPATAARQAMTRRVLPCCQADREHRR
jgi:hypothetical protein